MTEPELIAKIYDEIEVIDDYGDSEVISDILENVYKLSKEDVDIVMKEYWG